MINNTAFPRKYYFVIRSFDFSGLILIYRAINLAWPQMFKGCVDWAVQLINHYSLGECHKNLLNSPLDSDFSIKQPYPALNNWV